MRLFSLALFALLVSCAPARLDRSGLANANVITAFLPDKGEGAKYPVGQQVRFDFAFNRAGYATLISYGPTGNTAPLESNVLLGSGKHVFPRSDDRQGNAQAAYVVGTPVGTNRVILVFSSAPLKNIPRGKLDERQLEDAIRASVTVQNSQIVDVAETSIEVTP
jgi:hypothetical protein